MTADPLFDPPPSRPAWLMTLADLALLLTGTLLLFQALGQQRAAATAGIRQAFAGQDQPPALALAAAGIDGFAPGSAVLPRSPAGIIAWSREALTDPRVMLTVTGSSDATANDVDGETGSAALLAADRARAVLKALVAAGLPAQRIALASSLGGPRAVTVTLAFDTPASTRTR